MPKIKYFHLDGTETEMDVLEKPDGTIVLPHDMKIDCGCRHQGVNPWPSLLFVAMLCVTVVGSVWIIFGG